MPKPRDLRVTDPNNPVPLALFVLASGQRQQLFQGIINIVIIDVSHHHCLSQGQAVNQLQLPPTSKLG
jgi:hypothetical protein